jgi:Na+-transporting NADH:ubiquinone oxidoreductase subunit F
MLPVLTSSVVVFILVVILLAFLILTAKATLLPQGDVQIVVNNNADEPLVVKPGSSLLSTLASKDIFLASACGGGGTCAMCTCMVYEGGGEVLPTETNHLNRRQVRENMRLACQVKVKEDMKIRIPEEVFGIKKLECTVVSNYNVATFIKEFEVRLPEGETLDFKAGGYIQIDIPEVVVKYEEIEITAHPSTTTGPISFRKTGTNSICGRLRWSTKNRFSGPTQWLTIPPRETS